MNSILYVVFAIVSVLLVLAVVIQDDGQNGMGGLLGGRGTQAFGSQTANVLTKATVVLVVLFFGLALALALVNKVGSQPKTLDDSGAAAVSTDAEVPAESNWTDELKSSAE